MKLGRTRELTASARAVTVGKVLMILLKGVRAVTRFYLKCSKDIHSVCRPSPISDFVNDKTSIVVVVMQYYGNLAKGTAQTLRLLYLSAGFPCYVEFLEASDDEGRLFRASLYAVSCSMYRRSSKARKQLPLSMITLQDDREDQAVREAVGACILDGCAQCRGRLVNDFVIAYGVQDTATFFTDWTQVVLRAMSHAWTYAMTVADVERAHKRSKDILTSSLQQFANFSSKHYLEDVRSVVKASAAQSLAMIELFTPGALGTGARSSASGSAAPMMLEDKPK